MKLEIRCQDWTYFIKYTERHRVATKGTLVSYFLQSLAVGKRRDILRNIDSAKRKHRDNIRCVISSIEFICRSVCCNIGSMVSTNHETITMRTINCCINADIYLYNHPFWGPSGVLSRHAYETMYNSINPLITMLLEWTGKGWKGWKLCVCR